MDQNLKSTVENMDAVPLMVWGHYQQHVVRSRCLAYFSKILLNHILHGFGVADRSVYFYFNLPIITYSSQLSKQNTMTAFRVLPYRHNAIFCMCLDKPISFSISLANLKKTKNCNHVNSDYSHGQ